MNIKTLCSHLLAGILLVSGCSIQPSLRPAIENKADILFINAQIYTMEPSQPWASAIAIKGNRILAVLAETESFTSYQGKNTQLIDLDGKFLLPGFIDSHTHFSSAGALINDANLLTVANDAGLIAEMQRVSSLLEADEWITQGLWGAYEQWTQGSSGQHSSGNIQRWKPNRHIIDPYTQHHPVFINSFDKAFYLANSAALAAAGIQNTLMDGMELDGNGTPTGLIYSGSPAIEKIRAVIKPKSPQRLMNENRAALKELREAGVVEIHDITDDRQMEHFVKLQRQGELTVRVWMRADLSRAQEFNDKGIKMGTHPITRQTDNYLRWGAYKGYIDGIMGNHTALFFEPYSDQPDNYGAYRHQTSDDPPPYKTGNMEKMYAYLKTAHQGGFIANVHAIGTKGTALMLDTYERLMQDIGHPLDGYRVIHCQVVRPQDFPRFKELNVIAEVNPYHLSDDMRWMEERIGHERSKGAYAFKSLLVNGATLVFGSDWPGTNAAKYFVAPKYLLHAAVNRTTVQHTPEGGWFPEQKITMEEALKAYTINAAKATLEEHLRGSLKPGKLADITVLDKNLLTLNSKDILKVNVEMTMVDGKIVYRR